MSTNVQKTPKAGRQSLFFQDLATPVSARRGKFSSPGQAAAVSALWRESFGGSDLPPPPVFTLEERLDVSPETGIIEYPKSPEVKSDPRTPLQSSGRKTSPVAERKSGASTSYAYKDGQINKQGSAGLSWLSSTKSGSESADKGTSSPLEGVVRPDSLITLPSPQKVAKPQEQRDSIQAGNLDDEDWITVYGFAPADTNLVLRELEKCGVIFKHAPGPRGANWMHILYQNRSDEQRALSKNGMQISDELMIGVKPVDPMLRESLNKRRNNHGFMTLPPTARTSELETLRASHSPYYVQNGIAHSRKSGVIASPNKSTVSKIMDMMFGV